MVSSLQNSQDGWKQVPRTFENIPWPVTLKLILEYYFDFTLKFAPLSVPFWRNGNSSHLQLSAQNLGAICNHSLSCSFHAQSINTFNVLTFKQCKYSCTLTVFLPLRNPFLLSNHHYVPDIVLSAWNKQKTCLYGAYSLMMVDKYYVTNGNKSYRIKKEQRRCKYC